MEERNYKPDDYYFDSVSFFTKTQNRAGLIIMKIPQKKGAEEGRRTNTQTPKEGKEVKIDEKNH